jgi:hypothetical protein
MYKKLLVVPVVLLITGSAWEAIGGPYIGEQAVGWGTGSAVTLNSSDNAGWFDTYAAAGLINGGAFMATATGKPPFEGAGYLTDGWSHTSDPGQLTWITANLTPKTSPAGVNCQVWAEFTFDKVYSIKDITVWNSGMAEGAAPQRSWKDTVISWSTDGSTWSSMNHTFNQTGIWESGGYFQDPSDPAIAFANDAKYVVFSGLNNYGGGEYMMSEVRFNLNAVPEPTSFALLGLGGLALLLRRKS